MSCECCPGAICECSEYCPDCSDYHAAIERQEEEERMAKAQAAKNAIPDDESWGEDVPAQTTGTLIKFPEDEKVVVIGIVTGVSDVESKFENDDGSPKMQRRYTITVDGEPHQFYAKAMLDQKLRTVMADHGLPTPPVRITSTGDTVRVDGSKFRMREFIVQVKS